MEPFYRDDALTVWQGDCRAVLAGLEAESVHCVVTSPPYWGLRDYGTASWSGGDADCTHVEPVQPRSERPMGKLHGGFATVDAQDGGRLARHVCRSCGAVRVDDQLGLEPTPELYVEHMVDVFREVRRVLRRDGTVWLNLGDSYVAAQGGRQSAIGEMPAGTLRKEATPTDRPVGSRIPTSWAERDATVKTTPARGSGRLKPKDLVGIPWRVAFALQEDGWYLRRDIVWSKPNPMPESVLDRPTSAHEYVFLLTKSPRYYFDADAVREPSTDEPARPSAPRGSFAGKTEALAGDGRNAFRAVTSSRNIRSVWTIATDPYPGAHYATFPRKLVEPCVLAGTSERGVCPDCGAPWMRVVDRVASTSDQAAWSGDGEALSRGESRPGRFVDGEAVTTGWRPSCRHGGEPDDYETIRTPVGEGPGGDYHRARLTAGRGGPITRRRGLDRERAELEGVRPMYRWEQRAFARQLRALEPAQRTELRKDAHDAGYGYDAFDHWLREDRSGARAIPPQLLERWLARGWLTRPEDASVALEPIPATVLDPFAGSGTTGLVAQMLGRRAVLVDLNGAYLMQAMDRNRQLGLFLPAPQEVPSASRTSAPWAPLDFGLEEAPDGVPS